MAATPRTKSKRLTPGLWIQRFPWCRGIDQRALITPPRYWSKTGPNAYPESLRRSHLVVDEAQFVQFVRRQWQVSFQPHWLAVLEFFGLVMPVRKVLTEPLALKEVEFKVRGGTNHHDPEERWFHQVLGRGATRRPGFQRVSVTLEDPGEQRRGAFRCLRVVPTPRFGYLSMFYSDLPDHRPSDKPFTLARRIPEHRPGRHYQIRDLMQMGLWFRPRDPAYWALLARGLRPPAGNDLDEAAPTWVTECLRGESANVLQMSAPSAQAGTYGVTRLYIVGCADKGAAGRTDSPYGHPGQDWIVGTLLYHLEQRSGLDLLLELHDATRSRKVNANQRVLHAMAERWTHIARRERGRLPNPIPRLIPNFHRNALLWLLYSGRGTISPDVARKQLGAMVGMTPRSVSQACWAGGRSLRGL